jgi:hypothetical protein
MNNILRYLMYSEPFMYFCFISAALLAGSLLLGYVLNDKTEGK